MKSTSQESMFHAFYREPGPLQRKYCNHALFEIKKEKNTDCQFAKIDKYLFGLTKVGIDMFKCFLENPELLVSKYGWEKIVIKEIMDGANWVGERISYLEAMKKMKKLSDITVNYPNGAILFLFSRNKVNFNVEIYSTEELNYLEGFIIASIDSENFKDYFSLTINEINIIEIECDYGLNKYPDNNPWDIIYNGIKLSFPGHEIFPI